MRAEHARALATQWASEYAQSTCIVGAMINGSAASIPGAAELPSFSDVDINVLIDGALPGKIGKIVYKGILLDVSFAQLPEPEEALLTYEIAGSYRDESNILIDEGGALHRVVSFVSARFEKAEFVEARLERVFEKIRRGMGAFSLDNDLLQNVNPFLFPAGITAHAVLVAAKKNPTVRLRYLRAREVLAEWGNLQLYEEILNVSGFGHMTAARTLEHLHNLEAAFDAASALRTSDFPFGNDLTEYARPIIFGGSRALIDANDHREAMFWICATWERCRRVIESSAPDMLAKTATAFHELLADVGADTNEKIARRIAGIEAFLPQLHKYLRGQVRSNQV